MGNITFLITFVYAVIVTVMIVLYIRKQKLLHNLSEENDRLRLINDSLRQNAKKTKNEAKENYKLYVSTMDDYRKLKQIYDDTKEDLIYAKSIISGDLTDLFKD